MADEDIYPVYAQYHEDIIIASLLPNVEKGFYVDVGANHETFHSVTKYFYDKGWHGINIEPNKRLISEIEKKRKRDVNICVAASDKEGKLSFREYLEHDGFSTLSEESKTKLDTLGIPYKDYQVPVRRLENIFKENNVRHIDFMKIDVEGYELEVISGNDWVKYHPTVVCVESTSENKEISRILKNAGYKKIIFDGLNEYYLFETSKENFVGFADRATTMAHHSLREHHYKAWQDERTGFVEHIAWQDEQIRALAALSELTLKNKTYMRRLITAFKGLTVDYIRYKKSKHKNK